jgi:hypothetical protein
MAVVDFDRGGISDLGHFDIEVQRQSGHRMIAVQRDIVPFDLEHCHQLNAVR